MLKAENVTTNAAEASGSFEIWEIAMTELEVINALSDAVAHARSSNDNKGKV